MPAPASATYSAQARIDAHTAFRTLVDAGSGAGRIRIRDAADVLLAEISLNDPCGTVNGTTGQLVLSIAGPDTSANANGTAAYGEVCDSDGVVHLALPTQQGVAAVSGKLVLNTLAVVAGGPVEILSAVIG
ncbi:MAG TPA: hypothetical protein P5305_03760 [Rubrivivax sp.]|nr:hypothetical protein [Rubrivivax sp.]HRY86977.1 hypothetical protein [Rubrivivax sp.]